MPEGIDGHSGRGHLGLVYKCRIKIPCKIPCKLIILCFRSPIRTTEDITHVLDELLGDMDIVGGFSDDSFDDAHWDPKKDGKDLASSSD